MQAVLTALKDIPGVLGSFVLSPQGALVAREMPAIYPDSAFPEMGRRLASVGEALETQISSVQDVLLKYEGHWLFVRRTTLGFLSILTTDGVNFPALKMASNVALKQVAEQLAKAPSPKITVPTLEPTPLPPVDIVVPPPIPAPKPRRMWRGLIVD